MAKFEQLSNAIRSGRYQTPAGARRAIAYAKGITKAQRKTLDRLILEWEVPGIVDAPDQDPPLGSTSQVFPGSTLPDRGSASGETEGPSFTTPSPDRIDAVRRCIEASPMASPSSLITTVFHADDTGQPDFETACFQCGYALGTINASEAAPPDSKYQTPMPMRLCCEACGKLHIDEGQFATKAHHTHSCQFCGLTWRPAIGPTVGVQFLPGFKEVNMLEAWNSLGRRV